MNNRSKPFPSSGSERSGADVGETLQSRMPVSSKPCLLAGSPEAVTAMAARHDKVRENDGGLHRIESCGGRWALAASDPDRLVSRGRYTVALLGTPYWQDGAVEDQTRERDAGPAAAFLAALERFGEDAPMRTHGALAVAWTDEEQGTLCIAIDRAGMQDLYWRTLENGLVAVANRCDLASAAATESSTIDPVSLYNYLFYYCVPGPRTIFRGTHRLLPAEMACFGQAGPTRRRYWQMPYGEATERDPKEWHAALREALSRGVARARESALGESGCFLSGGLDSSSLAGFLAAQCPNSKSFTIRFHETAYDEGAYARLAAEHFATDHYERYVLPEEVLPVMDLLAWDCDQPYGNTSAVAAYYCAQAGREAGVKTMIAGDGGDELFAGNERYVHLGRYDVYGRIPLALRRYILDPLLVSKALDPLPLLGKVHRLRQRYAMSLPQRMFAEFHPFDAFGLEDVVACELLSEMRRHDPVEMAEEPFEATDTGDDLQRMMAVDLKLTIADNDLVKVNRACSLANAEVRYPMLDTEVMELAARIPSVQMLAGGRLRGLFKDAMDGFLPPEILTKPKHGFGLPFKTWAGEHGALREKILDTLNDLRGRKIFTERYIEALSDACRTHGQDKLRGNAWDAAMLELWLQAHEHRL